MPLVKLQNDEAFSKWRKVMNYESAMYNTWITQCKENRQFYFGEQYTQAEKTTLAERGQYDIVINKTRKNMRGITGMMAASAPKYKIVPVGSDDVGTAKLCNRLLDWHWQNSGGVQTFRKIIKNAAIDNICYFHVIYAKDGLIKFVPLYYDDVVVDPNSKDPLFRDAEMIMIKKYMPFEEAKIKFGVTDLVTEMPNSYYDTRDIGEYNLTVDFLKKIYSNDRQYVKVYECYRKIYIMQNDGTVKTTLKKEILLGYQHMYEEVMPPDISEYPIIPVYAEDTENPYKFGEVHFLKDLQRYANKTFGVVLYNAQLMSNPKIFVRQTDIPNGDITTFENNMANPGSITVLNANAEPPIIVGGQQINTAMFTLFQHALQEIEFNTIPAMMLGQMDSNKMQSPNGGSFLLDMKESVLDAYKDFSSNIENACTQLAKVLMQYTAGYLDMPKVIKVIDENGSIQRLELNKKEGLDITNEQSVKKFMQVQKQNGMKEEQINQLLQQASQDMEFAKTLDYVLNDVKLIDVDIFVLPSSYTPTYDMAMLRLMMELVQTGAVDPSIVLKYAPVENRQELIDRYDTLKQMQQQLQQMTETIKEYESQISTKDQQITKQKVDMVVNKEQVKLDRMQAEQKLKAYLQKHSDKLQSKSAINELSVDIAKILMEEKIESIKRRESNKEVVANTLDELFN